MSEGGPEVGGEKRLTKVLASVNLDSHKASLEKEPENTAVREGIEAKLRGWHGLNKDIKRSVAILAGYLLLKQFEFPQITSAAEAVWLEAVLEDDKLANLMIRSIEQAEGDVSGSAEFEGSGILLDILIKLKQELEASLPASEAPPEETPEVRSAEEVSSGLPTASSGSEKAGSSQAPTRPSPTDGRISLTRNQLLLAIPLVLALAGGGAVAEHQLQFVGPAGDRIAQIVKDIGERAANFRQKVREALSNLTDSRVEVSEGEFEDLFKEICPELLTKDGIKLKKLYADMLELYPEDEIDEAFVRDFLEKMKKKEITHNGTQYDFHKPGEQPPQDDSPDEKSPQDEDPEAQNRRVGWGSLAFYMLNWERYDSYIFNRLTGTNDFAFTGRADKVEDLPNGRQMLSKRFIFKPFDERSATYLPDRLGVEGQSTSWGDFFNNVTRLDPRTSADVGTMIDTVIETYERYGVALDRSHLEVHHQAGDPTKVHGVRYTGPETQVTSEKVATHTIEHPQNRELLWADQTESQTFSLADAQGYLQMVPPSAYSNVGIALSPNALLEIPSTFEFDHSFRTDEGRRTVSVELDLRQVPEINAKFYTDRQGNILRADSGAMIDRRLDYRDGTTKFYAGKELWRSVNPTTRTVTDGTGSPVTDPNDPAVQAMKVTLGQLAVDTPGLRLISEGANLGAYVATPDQFPFVRTLGEEIINGARSVEQGAPRLLKFSQSFEYVDDILPENPKHIRDSLLSSTGDCEDSVEQFVSLAAAQGYDVVILYLNGHVLAGVAGGFSGEGAEIDGKRYYFAETTNPVAGIGQVATATKTSRVDFYQFPGKDPQEFKGRSTLNGQ